MMCSLYRTISKEKISQGALFFMVIYVWAYRLRKVNVGK